MTNFYFDHFFYKSLENTNDTAKKIYNSKKSENIALLTLLQKSGRGRTDKKWISKKGDLTCSFLISFQTTVNKLGQINLWFINKVLIILKKSEIIVSDIKSPTKPLFPFIINQYVSL